MLDDNKKQLIQAYLDNKDDENSEEAQMGKKLVNECHFSKRYYLELLELNAVLKQWWMKTKH